jgi:acetoin utilization deacetylase AcuC-like enzyme
MNIARDPEIHVFYRPEQVLEVDPGNFSKSPLKPRLLLEFLEDQGLGRNFVRHADWEPFTREDFMLAHTPEYVDAFFDGEQPLCEANGMIWSPQFADSVRYTNASLYEAIKHSIEHPAQVAFSPTSGFHHARPSGGSGFCTFSGQVIAALKLYRDRSLVGTHIDLDSHFGNSIEDSRRFVPDLNLAIPPGCNINPDGSHGKYLDSLSEHLANLEKLLLRGDVDYVVFAHGADSHEEDDLGGQCTTEEWLEAADLVYTMIDRVSQQLGRPVPLSLALFGGYRNDNFDMVLRLHTEDLIRCLGIVCGRPAPHFIE